MALAVGVVAAAGEVVLRLTGLGRTSGYELIDGTIPKPAPNVSYMHLKEHRNLVRLNNLGFHDRDRPAQTRHKRLLVLGDSFVEGAQVQVEDLFTTQLEQLLAESGHPLEVVNGGMSSIGTAYEYRLWRDFFRPRLDISHVMVCVYMGNDLEDNDMRLWSVAPSNFTITLDARGDILVNRVTYPLPQRVLRRLSDYSVFAHTVYERAYLLKRQLAIARWRASAAVESVSAPDRAVHAGPPGDPAAWDSTVSGTLALLQRWRRELLDDRIDFSVVVIHSGQYYASGGYDKPHKTTFVNRLRMLGQSGDLNVLELDFSDVSPYQAYSFDGQHLGHFGYVGHQLAARQLSAWLSQSQQAPE